MTSDLSKKDWIKKFMGRYSKNKEALLNVYLETYYKWIRRRKTDFAYAPVKELKKACHHYFKYKELFIKDDSDSYKMGEACKWILKWNPDFEEWAKKSMVSNETPQNWTTNKRNSYSLSRLRQITDLDEMGNLWRRSVLANGGEWTDYYDRKPHRLYTQGMSLQYVSKTDRKRLVPDWLDYDFKNCHWAIFIQTFNIDAEYREFLQQMLLDSDAFMRKVCEESGNDYKIMKSRRNSILYGSRSGTGSPTLNRLRDYHQRYLKAANKDSTNLFYSLSRYESKMLDICRQLDPNWTLLMYDGWMTTDKIDTQHFQTEIEKCLGIKIIITEK